MAPPPVADASLTATTSDSPGKAVAMALIGGAVLSLNDAIIKTLVATFPIGQVLCIRGLFVAVPILLFAWRAGGLHRLRINSLKGQALRGICVVSSSFLFVAGLSFLPLAEAIAISFAGPLFVTALAPAMLGEHVGWRRWSAVLIGFAGVLFIVRPGVGAMQWAALFPVGAAVAGGMRDLITRKISATETSEAVLLVTTVVVTLAGLATWPLGGWRPIPLHELGLFIASGLLVGLAHFCLIESFRLGEAALVAPFKYGNLLWATLFGFLFFGQWPDWQTLAGAFVVVVSGLYILQREQRRRRLAATHARMPQTPA